MQPRCQTPGTVFRNLDTPEPAASQHPTTTRLTTSQNNQPQCPSSEHPPHPPEAFSPQKTQGSRDLARTRCRATRSAMMPKCLTVDLSPHASGRRHHRSAAVCASDHSWNHDSTRFNGPRASRGGAKGIVLCPVLNFGSPAPRRGQSGGRSS